MTDLSILAEKRGAASLASLILSFLIALPGAPIALAADEQAIHFKPLTDPQDAALVRTLLDETEGTLPAENLVIARFEDLPIRVIRVEIRSTAKRLIVSTWCWSKVFRPCASWPAVTS